MFKPGDRVKIVKKDDSILWYEKMDSFVGSVEEVFFCKRLQRLL